MIFSTLKPNIFFKWVIFKMGKVANSLKSRTRHTSSRFAGPYDLLVSDISTFKQVVQFSYKLNKLIAKKITHQ